MTFVQKIYKYIKRVFCCCFCCIKKKNTPPSMNEYFYEDSVQTNYVVCDV